MNIKDIDSLKKTYILILFMITIILIIEQLVSLSFFTYKYTTQFNLGNLLKNICNNSYVEFETNRFQISKDEQKLIIKNDTTYQNYTNLISYIVVIITLIYILLSFFMIFGHNFIQGFINIEDTFLSILETPLMENIKNMFYFISCLFLILIPFSIFGQNRLFKLDKEMNHLMQIILFVTGFYLIYSKELDISYFAFSIILYTIFLLKTYFEKHANADNEQDFEMKTGTVLYQMMKDIFINNKQVHNILVLLIIVLICFAISLVIQFMKSSNIIDKNETYFIFSQDTKDTTQLKELIYPLLLLFIIQVIVFASKTFNSYINHYILHKPNQAYKIHLKNISDIFDKMVENNMSNASHNSICINVANAVHLSIYNSIFNKTNSKILPKLNYETTCENNSKIVYNDREEYNPMTYFSELFIDKSDSSCIKYKNDDLAQFVFNVISHEKDPKKFENLLQSSIYNIINNKTYDGVKNLKFSDEYENNNNVNDEITPSTSITPYSQDIINDIVDIYDVFHEEFKNLTILMIKRLRKCHDKDDDGFSLSNISIDIFKNNFHYYDDVLSNNIKKSYMKRSFKLIEKMFFQVNNLLSDRITVREEDQKLTKFVVNSFNSFYDKHDKFYGNELIKIDKKFIDDISRYDGIDDIIDLLEEYLLLPLTNPEKADIKTYSENLIKSYTDKYENSKDILTLKKVSFLKGIVDVDKQIVDIDKLNKDILQNKLKEYNDIVDNINKINTETNKKKYFIEEKDSRQILDDAYQASQSVYILFVIYIITVLILNTLR